MFRFESHSLLDGSILQSLFLTYRWRAQIRYDRVLSSQSHSVDGAGEMRHMD